MIIARAIAKNYLFTVPFKKSIHSQSCENKIKPDQCSNTEYFFWLLSIILKHTKTQKTLKIRKTFNGTNVCKQIILSY